MAVNVEDLLTYAGGAGGLAMLGRWAITALKKQGLADVTLDSHSLALKNAQAQADEWKSRYDSCSKEHDATLILLGELRVQNRMLRLLLIHRGMSAEELDQALELNDDTT